MDSWGSEMSSIAILIPCYNEAPTIEKVVQDWRTTVPEGHVYVYDNNSSDDSVAIMQRLMVDDSQIHLRSEPRQGKGNVIDSMFRDIDADCYLMIDGDDTYPAEYGPEMIQLVLDGTADMVIGDRLSTTYSEENKRAFHGLGNTLVRRLINKLFGSHINDIMTGYRAFSARFVKGFPVLSRGFEIETEMSIHAVDKNLKLVEVPVNYRDRPDGSFSKLNTYSDGFKVLATIFRLFRSYRPLAFFGTIALVLLLVCLGFFIPIITEYSRTGMVPRYPTLIAISALAVGALVFWAVGLILDVVVKKNRQMYEVMTTYHEEIMRANRHVAEIQTSSLPAADKNVDGEPIAAHAPQLRKEGL